MTHKPISKLRGGGSEERGKKHCRLHLKVGCLLAEPV